MTMYEFFHLPRARQMDVLYQEGIYLAKRKDAGFTLVLYQLDSYYVEVRYRKYRKVIESLRCFHKLDLLEPYLEQIDVEELIRFVE